MTRLTRRSCLRGAAVVALAATTLRLPPTTLAAPTAGSSVQVSGTGGGWMRLRQNPDRASAVVSQVPEGATLVATGEGVVVDGYEWAQLRYNGAVGWGVTNYLRPVATSDGGANGAAPSATSTLAIGATVAVSGTGDGLPLRGGAADAAPIVGYAPEGATATIAEGPQIDRAGEVWYGVAYNGLSGWGNARYLAGAGGPRGTGAAGPGTAPAAVAPVAATTSADGNARGAAIAAAGLRYLGVPYVWGGATPAGWDCSGFVLYIVKQVTGQTMPRTTEAQIGFGMPVMAGTIRAGDLVFFANTYAAGITHVGIALGDGRMVHAGSPGTGTLVASLSDPYYASHFAGARRP